VQRKVFRIESMMGSKRPASFDAEHRRMTDELAALRTQLNDRNNEYDNAGSTRELKAELAQVHDTIASTMRDLGGLISDGKGRRIPRATGELTAAVDGMETATQKILKSAEIVDDSAKALAASLKTDYDRGLAQDIQDQVVQIYESCNFQDLAGQRIENVIATLTAMEQQVAGMLARCADASAAMAKPARGNGLLNGPKLDGDTGHASQHDIDKMFG
jgi:chemotaxis protein CheZ